MSKPNIDTVFLAFHIFQLDMTRIFQETRPVSKEQAERCNEVRNELKSKLATMGLADHIDWTES